MITDPKRRRKPCPDTCDCLCHDTGGGVHDHPGEPCPGKFASEYRIAFAGASGTGKTTLMTWLAERLKIPTNPVGARSVAAEMGFDNPYDVDKAGRRIEFQDKVIEAKVAWEARTPAFVTDRTTLDNLAYAVLHSVRSVTADQLALSIAGLERYTHIVYCPLAAFCNLGDDPVRVKDMTYHELFDVTLAGMLMRYCPDMKLTCLWEQGKELRQQRLIQVLGLT